MIIIDGLEFKEQLSIYGEKAMVLVKAHSDKIATMVEVPAEVNGKSVTCIGKSAFVGCNNLHYISLPDSIEIIEKNAFEGCLKLRFVKMYHSNNPAMNLLVEHRAFAECSELISCYFLLNVNASVEAFACCSNLNMLDFKFETISQDAFWGCNSLENIDFADDAWWDIEAFQNCNNLTHIVFWGTVDCEIAEEALDNIKDKKIKCTNMFSFLDWAYEGVDLEIFDW